MFFSLSWWGRAKTLSYERWHSLMYPYFVHCSRKFTSSTVLYPTRGKASLLVLNGGVLKRSHYRKFAHGSYIIAIVCFSRCSCESVGMLRDDWRGVTKSKIPWRFDLRKTRDDGLIIFYLGGLQVTSVPLILAEIFLPSHLLLG